MLARSKMSPRAIKEAFITVNDKKLSLDMLKLLRQLAPTQSEVGGVLVFGLLHGSFGQDILV